MSEIEAVKNIKAYMYYALDEPPRDVGIALTEAIVALREQAERESGCEWCADNYDHRHKTMFRNGSDWNYEAKYCDMCGKRLEEHHDAD